MQNERKLSKAVEKIAQSLPDAEFKKRYGKNWKSVKIATAEKLAEHIQSTLDERKGKTSQNKKKKKKRDRCLKIADRKFDKPSAYKSGAVVRCRKGNIWKGIKEEQIEEMASSIIQELAQPILEKKKKKKETLSKWFDRSGPKGKQGGWVDCNAPDGKGGYKACGRAKGEKRSKYPACRPTPAKCKDPGKGKTWGKTNEAQTGALIVDLVLGFFEYIIQKVGRVVVRKTLSPETLKKLIRGAYNEHDIVGRQVPTELNSILEKEIDSKQITNIDGLYRRIQQYKRES